MKLDFIELAGFRGFRDKKRFDLPGGFTVITGRNGTGKSTLLDAVDYALTGTINKYSVSSARGGGLSDHIWWVGDGKANEHHVSVGFVDDAGERFVLTRTRDQGPNINSEEVMSRLCLPNSVGSSTSEALMQTTLIRDELISALSLDLPEQARFTAIRNAIGAIAGSDHSDRTDAIFAEAQSILAKEKSRAEEIQRELGRLLSQLTEARTEAERSKDIAGALLSLDETVPAVPGVPHAETVRAFIANRKHALARFDDARVLARNLVQGINHVASKQFQTEFAAAETAVREAIVKIATGVEKVALAEKLDAAERATDTNAAHFAALIGHGSALGLQKGHCPLCDAMQTQLEFNAAITATRALLAELGQRLEAAAKSLRSAQEELIEYQSAEANAKARLAEMRSQAESVENNRQSILDVYESTDFERLAAEDIDGAEKASRNEQQRIVSLERALLVLEASGAVDRVTGLEKQIDELRNQAETAATTVIKAENVVEVARQISSAAKTVSNEILMEQFDTVMPLLKELYRRFRPHREWVEIDAQFGGKIRGSLNFTVGDDRNPQFLFSSGQRRAAGLAFLLAVYLSRPWCLWHSLLLDDPVQHIDDYRALNLVEVLAAIRRSGHQVIVAVEDPALADVLCRRLRSMTTEAGRRYDLGGSPDGAARVEATLDILPMKQDVLRVAVAS